MNRKNLLIITTDQHRGDAYGFEGRKVKTPHLDKLAASGTRFSNCITQSPICQPARASMLTGLYPLTHGVVDNGIDLPPETGEAGFAGQLSGSGYNTAFIGKAHFSSYNTFQPTGTPECNKSSTSFADDWKGPYMGFEEAQLVVLGHELKEMASYPKGQHYERWLRKDGQGEKKLQLYGSKLAPDVGAIQTWNSALPVNWHHSSWIGDRVINYLSKQNDEAPFCLWASFSDPHLPFDCPEPWSRLHHPDEVDLPPFRTRELDKRPWWHRAYVEDKSVDPEMDLAIYNHEKSLNRLPKRNGRARNYNDSEEQLRHTISNYYGMISLIDHNIGRITMTLDELGLSENTIILFTSDHGDWLGDHGMMLKGPMFYEGLLRVAMILKGPGIPENNICNYPVANGDMAATIMDYGEISSTYSMHNRSLRPLIEREDSSRDFAYGEWNLNPDHWGIDLKLRVVRTTRYKLTLEINSGAGELYDLQEDPYETTNLFEQAGAIRKELEDMIRARPNDELLEPLKPSGVH